MKTLRECQKEVAIKHKLGTSLVTGHKVSYFDEATEIYTAQFNNKFTIEDMRKAFNAGTALIPECVNTSAMYWPDEDEVFQTLIDSLNDI